MTTPSDIHVGRDKIVEQVIDRLTHPDDVVQSSKQFIQPGFYGLGGVGKSRLLRAIANAAAKVTPYVVHFDFAPGAEPAAPGSPLFFVAELIDRLDAIDQQQRSGWRLWDRSSRFEPCGRLLAAVGVSSAVVSLTATRGGAISGSPVTVNLSEQDQERFWLQLATAFQVALAGLRHPSPVEQRWGKLAEPQPRPLVVVLIDSLDNASAPMRAWLPQHLRTLLGAPRRTLHALAVLAGREQVAELTPTLLEPLDAADAVTLIRAYSFQAGVGADAAERLRSETPLRRAVIELAAGVPLLLQIFTGLALTAPEKLLSGQGAMAGAP